MNDKQQLAAIGEQLAAMGERMGVQAQPLCMAKRIEELEGMLREVLALVDGPKWQAMIDERKAHILLGRIDDVLSGKLPAPVAPEGWELVPVEPTQEMILAGVAAQAEKLKRYALGGSLHPIDHGMPDAYSAMLAAAPSPDGTK